MKGLVAYLVFGACAILLYTVGGASGWWKGSLHFSGGSSSSGGHGGGWGLGGGSGGGFRGGK